MCFDRSYIFHLSSIMSRFSLNSELNTYLSPTINFGLSISIEFDVRLLLGAGSRLW